MNTPLTDAFMFAAEKTHYPPHPYPIADFARKLERDRARLIELLRAVYEVTGNANTFDIVVTEQLEADK